MAQIRRKAAQIALGVEDISVARDLATPGGGLPGTKGLAAVGDDAFRAEALVAQVQQMHAPGRLVAMVLGRQQVAVRREDIGADENRLAGLVDLIVGADGNGPQVLGVVDPARLVHGVGEEVVDGPEAEAAVGEDGLEDLHHAPEGGMPDEHLRQDELAKPLLGHRKMEQHAVVRRRRREGLIDRLGRLGLLLVDELAADVVTRCQVGNRLAAGQGLDRQIGPLGRPKPAGGRFPWRKGLRVRRRRADEGSNHSTDSFRSTV